MTTKKRGLSEEKPARVTEEIVLQIDPWAPSEYRGQYRITQMYLMFVFTNVSGSFATDDFEGEPYFIDALIRGNYSPESNSTYLYVTINTSRIGVSEGKLKADSLKTHFESLFGVTLPYVKSTKSTMYKNATTYVYCLNTSYIERFRELFLALRPNQGFGNIVSASTLNGYASFDFWLKRTNDRLVWTIIGRRLYAGYFDLERKQEYYTSLRELTGYSGNIQASPTALSSLLIVMVYQMDGKFSLVPLDTQPSDMELRRDQTARDELTSFTFSKDIAGSSVEDLSVHFKVNLVRGDP